MIKNHKINLNDISESDNRKVTFTKNEKNKSKKSLKERFKETINQSRIIFNVKGNFIKYIQYYKIHMFLIKNYHF